MTDIHGGVEETHCAYILRDHDSDKLAARGETMQKAAPSSMSGTAKALSLWRSPTPTAT